MKTTCFVIALAVIPFLLQAQGDDVSYLDHYLEACNKGQATYVKKLVGHSELGYEGRIETKKGIVRATGYYRDEGLNTEHGTFRYYYDNGQIESMGDYAYGKKSGLWMRFDREGKRKSDKIYDSHVLADIALSDVTEDPVFMNGEIDPAKYLKERISTDNDPENRGTFRAEFIIERDGSVQQVLLSDQVNDLMDERIIQAIKEMPNWTPGKHNGETVRVVRQVIVKL